MGKLLQGTLKLEIKSVRNTGSGTDRYNAVVISTGESVSVKFINHGKDPHLFVGKAGTFDGYHNDIQTDPKKRINTSRSHGNFPNPFID